MKAFSDARGVSYESARIGIPRYDEKGTRLDGFTVRRTSLRPVDLKRAARALKKTGGAK